MKTFKTKAGTELPMLNLRGKDYLQVAHRIQWFREEKPDWTIETEFIQLEKDSSFCKATIKDPSGKIIATAHKSEDVKGFADHKEKAETGSIGRALALCGYGTQFAPELDEGERLADAPLPKQQVMPKSEDFVTTKNKVINRLKELGYTESSMAKHLGKADIVIINKDDVEKLIELGKAAKK